MSAQLNFEIENQIITRTDDFQPVARSQNYLRASFTFSDDWDGITDIKAIFRANGKAYEVLLDENGECVVPWEALTTSGTVRVSVYGGNRITANMARVTVLQSGYTGHATPTADPTKDTYEALLERMDEIDEDIVEAVTEALTEAKESGEFSRVTSINNTVLAGPEVIEAAGIPVYVSDVTEYSTFGITETGWYIFARIAAKDGVTVSDATTVTGAAGYIAEAGADHIDVAIKFEVAAMSGVVNITWDADNAETFVFKATDLAIRNLDYRVTFYVYDIDDFATWEYALTTDATFVADNYYYTEADGVYTLAEVTAGEAVPAYYTLADEVYTQATGTFAEGTTYYTKSGEEYTAAEVTAGEAIPAFYKHSKVTFEGMTRNITYRCNTVIDCPVVFNLPEIEDETHGCWYEIRFQHTGSFSSTLNVPEGVKVATEHTQAETKGMNMVDLHYTSISGLKLWRFMNTHSSIPA